MPDHSTYIARGASGAEYTFSVCTRIAELPECAGLYVFLRRDTGVLGIATPLYFGRADTSIANRIHGHAKWHEALSLGVNAIGVLECPEADLADLARREEDLVAGPQTPLNAPPGPVQAGIPHVH